MKKLLVVVAACLGIESAYATKARMSALGQDAGRGSFYLEDSRNIWRSAGHVNDLDQLMTLEHGTNYLAADGTTRQTATAEGGFFMPISGHQIGFYLNNDNYGEVDGVGGVESGRAELFFGRPSMMNLGLRLGYEAINIESNNTEGKSFDLGASVDIGEVSLWFNYVPEITITVGGADTDVDANMNLGANYVLGSYDLFFEYEKSDDDNSEITLGTARVNGFDGGFYFHDLVLTQTDDGTNSDTDISIALGVEYQATSWLQWRMSVRQSLLQSGDSGTSSRTTAVGAGAALTFDDLSIEGSLQGLANAANPTLGANNLLSNVSVNYNF